MTLQTTSVCKSLIERFRCPESLARIAMDVDSSRQPGYFQVGPDAIAYGKFKGSKSSTPNQQLIDALDHVEYQERTATLPFDADKVLDDLRFENYPAAAEARSALSQPSPIRSLYYALRPALPVGIRKWAQRVYLSDWQDIAFPRWPYHCSADRILEELLVSCIEARGVDEIPFVWFWPRGFQSCVVMTHDVEAQGGRDFTQELIDLDEKYGFKASFQVIPEQRYEVSDAYLQEIRSRGIEINVHDLTHDGQLFRDHDLFLEHARHINDYGKRWGAQGFRSGALYRRQEWFDALDFEYDMSVPTLGSLEPQRGGCCTVFPYFIGNLLEMPVTATQDYTLFHIFGNYSLDVWMKEINHIRQCHGMISFIVHPDYVAEPRGREVYESLLRLLAEFREEQQLWFALPREVNQWWRARSQTSVVQTESGWALEGPAQNEAVIAFARVEQGRLVYRLPSTSEPIEISSEPRFQTMPKTSKPAFLYGGRKWR